MEEDPFIKITDPVLTQEQINQHPQNTSFVNWARRRQVAYILITLFFLSGLIAYPAYKFFYKPASCFDEKQNQSEVGVDCGGECNIFCPSQVKGVVIDWAKPILVRDGIYDLAASIENPNSGAGVKNVKYKFAVYDDKNTLIVEKSGTTFIEPKEKLVVFEPGVDMGLKVPSKTVFEFEDNQVWEKMENNPLVINIKNKKLEDVDRSPKLSAVLLNNLIDDLFGIAITAVVSDRDGDIVAVSSTYEDVIKRESEKEIFFTWPLPFTTKPNTGCTAPADIILLFDRSGSMGFEGSNPPQPLTSAKQAASVFLDVDVVQKIDQVGFISFATFASDPIDQTLTTSHELVKESINSVSIETPALEQHTNIGDGIDSAIKELTSDRSNEDAKKAIVLLTDGVASRPLNPDRISDKDYPNNYARVKADLARDNDISVYSIGLGSLVDEEFLSTQISTTPDYYYSAPASSDLKKIYTDIAQAVCEEESFLTDIIIRRDGPMS